MENKKKMLSAIQPTGVFTLGNYIGAINNWQKNQEQFDCIYFIANMHSLTVKQNPNQFKNFTLDCVALLLACGIDPKKSLIFIQSQVPQHTYLSWILQCCTQFGELSRMTQFKDKSKKNADNINAGLFCYPILMAADILLYEPDFVPLGADQKQHMELTKTIANRFNKTYGETFKIPKAFIAKEGAKICSLANPENKMSKSDKNPNGTIYILDEEDTILEKFKKATTDSDNKILYDKENKPGISNLLEIYATISEITIEQAANNFKNTNYKDFKAEVGCTVANALKPIREKFNELRNDKQKLMQICEDGAIASSKIASNKLNEICEKVGLI